MNNVSSYCGLVDAKIRASDKFTCTEIKPDVGKEEKAKYKNPEYFGYNEMSFYDVEKSFKNQRGPQPKSGLTEYW